jgi:large subunit ribosomal protein L10
LLELSKLSAIANMPSREQALSQLAGMLNAPMNQFVNILNQVPSKLVRTLQAVKEQKESA